MKRVLGYIFVPFYWLVKAISLTCVRLRFKIIKRRVDALDLELNTEEANGE